MHYIYVYIVWYVLSYYCVNRHLGYERLLLHFYFWHLLQNNGGKGSKGAKGARGACYTLESVNSEHSTEMVILSAKYVSGTGERAHFHQFHLHKKNTFKNHSFETIRVCAHVLPYIKIINLKKYHFCQPYQLLSEPAVKLSSNHRIIHKVLHRDGSGQNLPWLNPSHQAESFKKSLDPNWT